MEPSSIFLLGAIMNTVGVASVLLIGLAVGGLAGYEIYDQYIHKSWNISWAYRFEYNGQIITEFDYGLFLESGQHSITVKLVNVSNTDSLTIDHIDLGCEAWESGFPSLSGIAVKTDSNGLYYVDVMAGYSIDVTITVNYPQTGTDWKNSLWARDDQTSLGGYVPDVTNKSRLVPWYGYGARLMIFKQAG